GGRQDLHGLAVLDLAGDEAPGQRRLDLLADEALERTSAEHRVVALRGELLEGAGGEVEDDASLVEPVLKLPQLDARDVAHLLPGQRLEDDDVVDAVEELGPELLAQ